MELLFMQINYTVSQDILDWVIRQTSSNIVLPKTLPMIQEWRRGTKIPTYNQIEAASKDTRIPLGYFFLKTPPTEKITLLEYRTIKSQEFEQPSRDLVDTIYEMEQVVEWTRNNLKAEGAGINSTVGRLKNVTDIGTISTYIRNVLSLTENWFEGTKNAEDSFYRLRVAISDAGIVVMMNGTVRGNTHRPLDVHEFRALTIIDEYAPLIFINTTDSINGRLFSLLHEFVHICLGANSLFNDRYGTGKNISSVERICNAVAAEILVPNNVFLCKWIESGRDEASLDNRIRRLALFFSCGPVVIARKALDAGEIDINQYRRISEEAIRHFIEKKNSQPPGGNYYATLTSRVDRRFFNLLFKSVSEGKTQYTEAFRLTNTNRITFTKLAERMLN